MKGNCPSLISLDHNLAVPGFTRPDPFPVQLMSRWQDDTLTLWHLSHHAEDNVIREDTLPWIPSYSLDNVIFDSFLQRHNPEHKVVMVTGTRLSDGVPGVNDMREGG